MVLSLPIPHANNEANTQEVPDYGEFADEDWPDDEKGYAQVMRSAIALNGSFFNTQRMLAQYVSNAYFPGG